ncbi:MAG: substrate-binding domain-containing protein, partial [Oscillospiraceae bacterium]|nr:substrate-binding domain-containing protein [Oscillospiraceae bacterium]
MKKRQMICVIASDCKYGRFSAETIKGIIAQAYACNCDIAVLTTLDCLVYDYQGAHRVAEREIYKLILSDSFDGYIYCKSPSEMPQDVMDYIESLLKKTNRFVMIADGDSDARFDYTQSDDFDDFRCMAEHLITVHGCQRIYCLTGPKGVFQSEERLKGYFTAMNSHGLPYDETYYDYGDFWRNYPKIYAQKILSGALQKPDAVVCGSDIMAYSLIEALENGGIHVPGDIAVTGYDGNEMGENPNIALTTFRRDNFQLGADCMRRLYRNITGKLSRRVKRKRSGFQLGHSCGCSGLPIAPGKERRQKRVTAMFRDHIQYTDMPFTLDHAKNVDELLTSASLTAYTIYNLKYLKISLTERYLNAVEQNITDDSPFDIRETMCQVYSRNKQYYAEEDTKRISFRADDVIHYFNLRADQPHAFYLTPIHAEKHFIGIAALSFGKRLFQYDDLYASYMRYLSHGLENLMRRNAAEYARYAYSGTSIRKPEGLLRDIQQQSSENVLIVCCEMQQVRQLYGKIGGRKLFQMMHKFAQELAMHMQPEESCCLFSDRTILMLLHSDERTDALF